MRRVLVVAPTFPPATGADMHRVRSSLPHFQTFGWQPHVLTIDPDAHGGLRDFDLAAGNASGVAVTRTSALPARLTRAVGIGNPGLRAFGHLYRAGSRLLRGGSFDLVYFSTTMFPVAVLGRLWKLQHGTPYVIDFQDAWKSDYTGTGRQRGIKANAARWMHSALEPLTMRRADGVVSVSPAYIEVLRRRYPWLSEGCCAVIPFGVAQADFEAAGRLQWRNPFFDAADGCTHIVSVGRGGRDLHAAADVLFAAIREVAPEKRTAFKLWFVGTDYANRGERTIMPRAAAAGVADRVAEIPQRLPYLQALRVLQDGQIALVLGSDDPAYSPSKIYPYLLAGRPFLAILHAGSPVAPLLEAAGTGVVVRIRPGIEVPETARRVANILRDLRDNPAAPCTPPSHVIDPLSVKELTRQQCALFDRVLGQPAAEELACAG